MSIIINLTKYGRSIQLNNIVLEISSWNAIICIETGEEDGFEWLEDITCLTEFGITKWGSAANNREIYSTQVIQGGNYIHS